MKTFMTSVIQLQTDLNEYRVQTANVPKVALYPKTLSPEEIQAIKVK